MELIKRIVGKFYLQPQVKSQISRNYLRDAHEWLRIYKILVNEQQDYISKSLEAKKFIHLWFSVECSLKSIIMSLSNKNESALDAYKILIGCQHNLTKLYKVCLCRAAKKYRIISPSFVQKLAKIDNLKIGIRYDLNFKTAYKKQSLRELFFDGPVSGVVLDDSFRKEFFEEAIKLYKRASKLYGVRFAKHGASTAADAGKVDDYIKTKIVK